MTEKYLAKHVTETRPTSAHPRARSHFKAACLLAAVSSLLPWASGAQQEYSTDGNDPRPRQFTRQATDIDRVDLHSGALTVRHTDVVIPGNGHMDITVERVYNLASLGTGLSSTHTQSYQWTALGPGWSLRAAPRIVHENSWYLNYDQGVINYTGDPLLQLCSGQAFFNFGANIPALELPGGEQLPLYSGGNYIARTKNNWKVECKANAQITATSPAGMVYDFGTYNSDRRIGKYFVNVLDASYPYPTRSVTYMDAKKATDVSGNWIAYSYQAIGTPIAPWPMPAGYSGTMPEESSLLAEYNERPSYLLSQITSSDGRSVTFTYDSQSGRLQSISDGARTWSYAYLAPDVHNSQTLSQVTMPSGVVWGYEYYPGEYQSNYNDDTVAPLNNDTVSVRKLRRVVYPAGGSVSYEYSFQNISQQYGVQLNRVRRERVSRRSLSTGESWSYSYARGTTGQYDTTTVVGPEGTTVYKYMGPGFAMTSQAAWPPPQYQNNAWRIGLLMQKQDPTGRIETLTYQQREIVPLYTRVMELGAVHDQSIWAADLSSRTIVQDGVTHTTTYSGFDAYGNAHTKVESGPNGGARTTSYTYLVDTAKWIVDRVKDEVHAGNSILRTFDANGKMTSLTRNGVTTSYTHDSQGNIATVLYPRGLLHTLSNYKRGVARNISQPESVTISRVVDDAGNITSETDGEGHTTGYSYDGLGRLTSIDHPRGNDVSIAYTSTSRTLTRGAMVETTTYDGFSRPVSVARGGVTHTYRYDGLGRRTFESNPNSTIGVQYAYDAQGRLTRLTNPDSTFREFVYGPANLRVRDERGNNMTYGYRAYGNPDKAVLMSVTAADPTANVSITRGADDLIGSVTQAGVTRSFGYDSRKYLTSYSEPEVGATTFERDAAGNLTARIVSGVRADHAYDGQNRLTGIAYSDSTPAISRTYTRTGKVRTAGTSGVLRVLDYDTNDNLTGETLTIGSVVLDAQYAYDGNDQLASTTYPVSNRVVSYSPDALGRPTQASGYVTSVSHWPSGSLQQLQFANGVVGEFEQNARLWPAAAHTRRGNVYYASSVYGYDGVGNLTGISDAIDAGRNRSLGYDNLDRLTSASGPWGAGSIGYDGAGNINNQSLGSFSLTYSYDSNNRLTGVAGSRSASYAYDSRGNMSAMSGVSYWHDSAGDLRCANCAGANRTDYAYDGLQRVSVTKSGITSYEFRASGGELLAEYTPSQSNRLVEHIYLNGMRVAQRISDDRPATAVSAARSSVVANGAGEVTLTVNIGGTSPAGTVTFSEGGNVIGTAYVVNGQASISVLGMALGSHTITVSYSGDAVNSGNAVTLNIRVVDLSWLPAVLDLVLN